MKEDEVSDVDDDGSDATDSEEYYTNIQQDDAGILHSFEDGTVAEIEVFADSDLTEMHLIEEADSVDQEDDHSALYKCDNCDKSFPSMASLRTHNYIHNQGHFKCEICPNKVLTTPGFLRLHMEKIHNVFVAKDAKPATTPTDNKTKLCKICNRYFSKIGIISHMRSHDGNVLTSTTDGKRVMKCPLCLLTFSCRKNVQRHMRRVHAEDQQQQPHIFTCDICPQSFQVVVQLYEHYKTHDEKCEETVEGFNLNCDNCDARLQTYEEYAKHSVDAHQNDKVKAFKCRLCGLRQGTRVALYSHINCHYVMSTNREEMIVVKSPFRKRSMPPRCLCPVCGADLCTRQILKQHMLIHGGVKPFTCSICAKLFRSKSALTEHVRGEPNAFNRSSHEVSNSAQSFAVHTDERPYRCDVCDKGFRSHSNLRNHKISTHTDVAKHACHVCGKSFKFSGNLKAHLWTHSDGQKPYNCEKCGTGFLRLGKLKAHSKTCTI